MVLLLQNTEAKVPKKGTILQCLRCFTLNRETKVPRCNLSQKLFDFFGVTNMDKRRYAKSRKAVLFGMTPLHLLYCIQLIRHRGKTSNRRK